MTIDLITTRAIMFGGVRHEPGARIQASVQTASELVRVSKARLADPADLALLVDMRNMRRGARREHDHG